MNEDTFWQLIEDCRPAGPDPEAELLAADITERLARSSLALVTGFAEQLSWALYQLDRKEYGQGLSGGRLPLHARRGRRRRPTGIRQGPAGCLRLRPFVIDGTWAESLLYAPDRAYERTTGEEPGRDTRHAFESYSNAEGWAG
ncbi:hypothetical protein ACFVZ3_30350 [Kitasatospora purpeofusca]|uniref:hypothetical protein n=1 Tax=Kitasatospora purpeofusca TaxID=67352 RepID=UPI0036B4AF73